MEKSDILPPLVQNVDLLDGSAEPLPAVGTIECCTKKKNQENFVQNVDLHTAAAPLVGDMK